MLMEVKMQWCIRVELSHSTSTLDQDLGESHVEECLHGNVCMLTAKASV